MVHWGILIIGGRFQGIFGDFLECVMNRYTVHTGHIVTLKKQRLREHELGLVALLFYARRLALLDFTFHSFPFVDCFLLPSFFGDVGIRTCLGLSGDIASLLRDWLLAASETLNLASCSKTWRKCSQGRQASVRSVCKATESSAWRVLVRCGKAVCK